MSSACRDGLSFALTLVALGCATLGCERESRQFRGPSGSSAERQAYAVSEGKALFTRFNCVGCHSRGGGGMGPPLMDAAWTYGSEPASVYATIVQGRPNGMPAFGSRLSTGQVWQLTAYVRSMSGLLAKDVAPGRDDGMQVRSQEQSTEKAHPALSRKPPAPVQP
jgi:cytochrome c oxidase cbb3-type subunit 3